MKTNFQSELYAKQNIIKHSGVDHNTPGYTAIINIKAVFISKNQTVGI